MHAKPALITALSPFSLLPAPSHTSICSLVTLCLAPPFPHLLPPSPLLFPVGRPDRHQHHSSFSSRLADASRDVTTNNGGLETSRVPLGARG